MTSSGYVYVATSSGGPWLKQPGRVGSAAMKGSGFDFCPASHSAAVATGHGENIIEHLICHNACRVDDLASYVKDIKAYEWDLGIVKTTFIGNTIRV